LESVDGNWFVGFAILILINLGKGLKISLCLVTGKVIDVIKIFIDFEIDLEK